MRTLALLGALCVLATGCSFTTAAGLEQCETSADCGENQVCTEGFCIPQPTGCGTRYGATDANAIPLAAMVPISISTDPADGVDESDLHALNAVVLALDEVNQRIVSGRKLSLHLCDTAGDAERTMLQAQWLVKEKQVAAVLTAGSGQTLTAAAVTVPAGVLTMSYSASSPELTSLPDTNGGPVGLVWRTSPSDAIQGHIIADQLRTNTARFPNVQKVGILYVDDPYGQGLYNVISTRLSATTPRLDSRGIPYRRRGDVPTALSQLSGYAPDITVLIGFRDDATLILKESSNHPNLLRSTGHRWFFTDSVKDAALLVDPMVRDLVQGFYGTAPAQGAGQAFKSFQDRFKAKYGGKDPAAYAYTANAYDAMYLVALGAAYAQGTSTEVTGTKLAEGLTRVSTGTSATTTQLTSSNYTFLAAELVAGRSVNIEGASGRLDFDSAGEAPAPIELWQVSGQGFATIDILEPSP